MWEWFCGRQIVQEVLEAGCSVKKLLVATDASGDTLQEISQIAAARHINIERVPKRVIEGLVRANHQGVAVQAALPGPMDFKNFLDTLPLDKQTFIGVLDEVQDPQNVGAILRSAAAFGCKGVVISKWRQAGMSQAVMRASSGAAMKVPLAEIANIGVAIERLKEKGFWIYGASVEDGHKLENAKIRFPMAIVLGNEHRGIKPILKNNCDELLSISQTDDIQSLNVSCAASIFFHEIHMQALKAS